MSIFFEIVRSASWSLPLSDLGQLHRDWTRRPRVSHEPQLGVESHDRASFPKVLGAKAKREAVPSPHRTTACSRLPPASARASRPLPAAAEAQRSASFICHVLGIQARQGEED